MKGSFTRGLTGLVSLAVALAAPAFAESGPSSQDINNDAQSTGDVLSYGMGPWAQRFSPMTQINTTTVKIWFPLSPLRSAVKSSAVRKLSRSFTTA
jgi:alcohol dehydrogenase (cytochrome c)